MNATLKVLFHCFHREQRCSNALAEKALGNVDINMMPDLEHVGFWKIVLRTDFFFTSSGMKYGALDPMLKSYIISDEV